MRYIVGAPFPAIANPFNAAYTYSTVRTVSFIANDYFIFPYMYLQWPFARPQTRTGLIPARAMRVAKCLCRRHQAGPACLFFVMSWHEEAAAGLIARLRRGQHVC